MTFSPLIKGTLPHHNKYSSRQGQPIVRVVQHHWAGITGGIERLTDPNQSASATYIITSDGSIYGQVPEEFRPWTSGSFEADAPSITIEVQNFALAVNGSDNDPNSWKISNQAYDSIVRLLADVAKRYNWGGVTTPNYRGHREFSQTACPGGYIWNRMSEIRASANDIYSGGSGVGSPKAPEIPKSETKTVWQLADEVIAGVYGSGEARKKALGANYAAVQAEVNRRLIASKATSNSVNISQLADEVIAGVYGSGEARKKALGANYAAVQAEVNRRLGASRPSVPSISQLADAVIRGQYGSGEARKKALGANYAAVQAEVNRRLG